MNVLLSLLICAAIYIIIENISESIKDCVHEEESVSHVISKNVRFTADRKDPNGYERHKGVGIVDADDLRKTLQEEGFCEERINRFIRDYETFILYHSFLI